MKYYMVWLLVDYEKNYKIIHGKWVNDYTAGVKFLERKYLEVKNQLSDAKVVYGVIKEYKEDDDENIDDDRLIYTEFINMRDGHHILL